jgi:hypothetical protein
VNTTGEDRGWVHIYRAMSSFKNINYNYRREMRKQCKCDIIIIIEEAIRKLMCIGSFVIIAGSSTILYIG